MMTLMPNLPIAERETRSTWLKSKASDFGSSMPYVDSATRTTVIPVGFHHAYVFVQITFVRAPTTPLLLLREMAARRHV